MDTTKKTRRRTTGAKGAAAAAAAAAATAATEPVEMMIDPFIDFKGSLEVLVRNLERTVKQQQQPQQQPEEMLMMAQQIEEMEMRHEAHVVELQNAFQVQESENNNSFIKTIEGLELALKKEQETFKERVEAEIKSYMDVSLLNQYIKHIDALKKENDILTLKLDAKKKVLEKIQREHKELQLDMEILSLRSEAVDAADVEEAEEAEADEEAEEAAADDVEEAAADEEAEEDAADEEAEEDEEAAAEAEEDAADADEAEEAAADEEEEEAAAAAEEEEGSKEVVEVEVEVEIDVSKLDVIEVDDVEYYLDLDNNILDKNTLDILGTLTSDGDALFNWKKNIKINTQ